MACNEFSHIWKEEYYGWKCTRCGDFIPFGQAPWEEELQYDDADQDDEYDPFYDGAW